MVNILVPPLRERRDEVPALVAHFLERFAARYGRPPRAPSARLRALLERHPFRGNVRELENLVKRIVVLGSEEPIVRDLLAREREAARRARRFESLLRDVEEHAGDVPLREVGRRAAHEAEREAIEQALLLPAGTASTPRACSASATRRCFRRSASASSRPTLVERALLPVPHSRSDASASSSASNRVVICQMRRRSVRVGRRSTSSRALSGSRVTKSAFFR